MKLNLLFAISLIVGGAAPGALRGLLRWADSWWA